MASNFKWRMGFGEGSLLLFAVATGAAIFFDGAVRYVAGILSVLTLAFMIFQWRKWNKHGWQQVHFRAMLLYAAIAGEETGRAQREGREFDRVSACRSLANMMCGKGREANVEAMISDLVVEKGGYLGRILETYGAEIDPKIDKIKLRNVVDHFSKLNFGPQLVICNIVENSFGGQEAARYVLALANRQAH